MFEYECKIWSSSIRKTELIHPKNTYFSEINNKKTYRTVPFDFQQIRCGVDELNVDSVIGFLDVLHSMPVFNLSFVHIKHKLTVMMVDRLQSPLNIKNYNLKISRNRIVVGKKIFLVFSMLSILTHMFVRVRPNVFQTLFHFFFLHFYPVFRHRFRQEEISFLKRNLLIVRF